MTEENNIIKDWDFLMQDLSKSKIKRHKYARIYEKIIRYNKKTDTKMLLSIAYRVFKKLGDIKMSKGHKNIEQISEFYEADFYVNGTIMVDQFVAFCDNVANMIIDRLQTIEKIGHLEIISNGQIKTINIMF